MVNEKRRKHHSESIKMKIEKEHHEGKAYMSQTANIE